MLHLLSARNLGFIFDEHLTLSDQISALSKSCYDHIRELRCIRPYLDFKTASTVAISIVHSELDYRNKLYYTVFQKKTSTHIIGYKLKNSYLILIIFDTKIPHII